MPENILITRAAKIVKKRLRVWFNEFNSAHSRIAYLYITKIFNFVRTLKELTRRSQFTILYRFRNSPSIIEDITGTGPHGDRWKANK